MKEESLKKRIRQGCICREEVVRLCLSLDLGAPEPVLRAVLEKASAEELMKLKSALKSRFEQMYPVKCQLLPAYGSVDAVESGFLI